MRYAIINLSLLALLLLSGLVQAQTGVDPDMSTGEIPYMSAGVGEDSSSPTPQGPQAWTLKMVFAEKASRSYVSDVEVLITDKDGKQVVEAFSDGPWFLVGLPNGEYELQATYNNQTEKQSVSIAGGKMQTLYFLFADSES